MTTSNSDLLGPRGYPIAYRVRDLTIAPGVVLAPMEGVTDLVFRRVIRTIGGPGLTYTEFIASRSVTESSAKIPSAARIDPDERPIALQIYGRDPQIMAEAARVLEGKGATIIDINMGCPSKKVCKRSGGSALMREPDLAVAIVRAVKAAIKIPLTVKMRSGFDASMRNAPELAWRCQEEGAEGITIHWRTREDAYEGTRQVDKIAETVQRVHVPVIGNGDIVDLESAKAMFDDTGCAGLMIGRGAIRNPWLPLQLGQWLRGDTVTVITAAERRRVLLMYYRTIQEAFKSDKGALGRIKMVIRHGAEDIPYGEGLRGLVLTSQSPDEAREHTKQYFDLLEEHEAGNLAPLADSDYAREAVSREARKAARQARKAAKANKAKRSGKVA